MNENDKKLVAIKSEKQLFVEVGSCIDWYRWDNLSSGAQFEEMSRPNTTNLVKVDSLKEASKTVLDYIQNHNLGSSSWTGGRVVDSKKEFVARVSYNGRVWASEGLKAEEIIL